MKFDIERIEIGAISAIIKTGNLANLPAEYQEYYNLMDFVRGLNARNRINDKVITKAAIIKLLKCEPYLLSDHQARRVYADALNFFYIGDGITADAWRNIYAEKLDKLTIIAYDTGDVEQATRCIEAAAKLRKCYEPKAPEIPAELYRKPNNIYTLDVTDLGLKPANRRELAQLIDSMPDIPTITRERVKAEADIIPYNIESRLDEAKDEFAEED